MMAKKKTQHPVYVSVGNFTPAIYYALRIVGENNVEYYDPARIIEKHGGKKRLNLGPSRLMPHLSKNLKIVLRAWERYETERIISKTIDGVSLPEMQILTFQTSIHETPLIAPPLDMMAVRQRIIELKHGVDLARAFELLRRTGTAEEYRYILFRKSGKRLMDDLMPNNFSYGKITFCRDEVELVQARLILSEPGPPRIIDMEEMTAV